MQYQALYRKHRPQIFSEVVGQDHVTHTLAREVVEGKVAHAYLFAGPRGTGKTTTARILAKSLNCTDRKADGEPCNACLSCVSITEGSSLDVIELDAASHNKVEDIREIRINVGTVASAGGSKRVYILDEAHMLSRAAGNALLKTLEEPPDHVVFVLATTEPYKLLDTIRSRSQRFDFHPVGTETLARYLGELAAKEEFQPAPGALAAIADHATGSVRDALSLMEQVAALGGGAITTEAVRRALGLADREAFDRLAEAVVNQDAPGALALVAALASEGGDLRRFVADGVAFFRGVFLAQYAPNVEEVVDDSLESVEQWRRHAPKLASADVLRAVDLLADALMQLREGREERLVVELAVIRLTRPETATDIPSLAARVARLEERAKRSAAAPVASPASREEAAPKPAPGVEESPPVAVPPSEEPEASEPAAPSEEATAPFDSSGSDQTAIDEQPKLAAVPDPPAAAMAPAEGLTLAQVEEVWPALAARVRDEAGPRRNAWFRVTSPVATEGVTMVIGVPSHLRFHLEHLNEDAGFRSMIAETASELLGGAVKVAYRPIDGGEATQPTLSADSGKVPEAHDLLEEGHGGVDPEELLKDVLGGEVVE